VRNLRNIGCIILLQAVCLFVSGQEIRTEKVRFNLKEITVVPLSIEILSPAGTRGEALRSTDQAVDLVGQVTSPAEVSYVTVNSKLAEVNRDGMFTFPVTLVPGQNSFRVVAGDTEKNTVEETVLISYYPPVVTLADKISEKSKYFGLIIGISNYRDESIPDLVNPVTDAEQVYRALVSNYAFEEENMHLLKDATRGDLIQALDELAGQVTPDDNLLIFYAGHGWWDEEAKVGYWLPSDADSKIKTNWFRNSALVDYLKEINTRHTLLITDACFGGSIFRTRAAFPNRETAYEKLYELPSRKAMTSGNLSEVPDNSSFTRYLVQRLNENEETYISSEQLYSSFRIAVINNSDAVPQYGEIGTVGDRGGDFIFIRKRK
jgi:hypothetical protein